ncbi:MAG: glycoside hydrolase family 18 protein [Planctomycetota bacterium]|nr:glycoside hydrolase family 18 protein [Planctomycetota bacterium]
MSNLTSALLPLLLLAACAAARAGDGEAPPKPERVVYAWFPADMNDWSTAAVDWSALTHICFRSAVVQADGTLKIGGGCDPEKIKALVAEAHAHKVKVCVLVWGSGRKAADAYLAEHAKTFADEVLKFLKEYGLDGVNLDDETWQEHNEVAGDSNRDRVNLLFKTLHDTLKAANPAYHISYAAPPVISADDKYGAAWLDFKTIVRHVDHITFMSYCMFTPTIGWTGSAQPVRGGGKVGAHARDYDTVIKDYLEATGGAKEKLVLGLGLHRGGNEWTVSSDKPLAGIYPLLAKPRKLTAAEAAEQAKRHGRRFDPEQQAPGTATRITTSSCRAGTRTTSPSPPSSSSPANTASPASASGSSTARPSPPPPSSS